VIFRRLAFCAGIVLVVPVGLLAVLVLFIPVTPSGALYLIGAALTAAGAITAPWRQKHFRGVTKTGVLLICLVAAIRLAVGARGTTVTLITLPGQQNTRWLDRLIHERDVALFGQQVTFLMGLGLSPREHDGLMPALHAAYAAMHEAKATTSSPFLGTYLGLQHPGTFDTVVIEPPGHVPARTAVVFLHGFTGNFTVQGWLVSRAVAKIGAVTVCPSVGWRGDWWTQDGELTVCNTLNYLHARGVKRVYLAGLSNGAVGTCRLASRFVSDLAGLILISGADPQALDAGLPILLLQGKTDERMPASLAIQSARQSGHRATYREFDGDHLLLAKCATEVQEVLAEWLRQQEAKTRAISEAGPNACVPPSQVVSWSWAAIRPQKR
jgi:pimeloyl-ACP methyl ester carboxylesterase